MDYIPTKETNTVIDVESCENTIKVGTPALSDDKIENIASLAVDKIVKVEEQSDHSSNWKTMDEFSLESGKKNKRENRKSMSGKKPPKPPRPPRGLSLDATDQKLIKEISELAMIRRARIERMKALKKMKESKAAASVSASWTGNVIAIVFTILFCLVIIFQGCHSSGSSPRNKMAIVPTPGLVEVQGLQDSGTNVRSPGVVELGPGSDTKNEGGKG